MFSVIYIYLYILTRLCVHMCLHIRSQRRASYIYIYIYTYTLRHYDTQVCEFFCSCVYMYVLCLAYADVCVCIYVGKRVLLPNIHMGHSCDIIAYIMQACCNYVCNNVATVSNMGWLWLVGSIKL